MKKAELIFFLVGITILVYLVLEFGFDRLIDNLRENAWVIFALIGTYCGVYLLNTGAFRIILGKENNHISFARLFRITVSGFAINYVTPFVNLGGEPYKIFALSKKLETSQSVSSVVSFRMLHILAHLFSWLTAIFLAFFYIRLTVPLLLLLLVSGSIILVLVALVFLGHERGLFEKVLKLMSRIPFLRSYVGKLRQKEEVIIQIDEEIRQFYHARKKDFYRALGLEYLSRIVQSVELYLIFYILNAPFNFVEIYFIFAASSLIGNLLFFFPMEIGVKEGGLFAILSYFAFSPLLSIYIGILIRMREFFWIALGLGMILVRGGRTRLTQFTGARKG
ncbi:MAG: lysylphosphatidylglycerol synthase transmembrane domain-containing protein [Bacteroidota bacterium]